MRGSRLGWKYWTPLGAGALLLTILTMRELMNSRSWPRESESDSRLRAIPIRTSATPAIDGGAREEERTIAAEEIPGMVQQAIAAAVRRDQPKRREAVKALRTDPEAAGKAIDKYTSQVDTKEVRVLLAQLAEDVNRP